MRVAFGRVPGGAAAGAGGVDRGGTDRAGPGPLGLQMPPGVGGCRAAVGRLGRCRSDVGVDGARGGGGMGRTGVRGGVGGWRRLGACSEVYNKE